jgi:hypothetical protein
MSEWKWVAALLVISGLLIATWKRRPSQTDDPNMERQYRLEQLRHAGRMLEQAGRIFESLGPKPGIEDSDFLSPVSKRRIDNWLKYLHLYQQEIRQEIEK